MFCIVKTYLVDIYFEIENSCPDNLSEQEFFYIIIVIFAGKDSLYE